MQLKIGDNIRFFRRRDSKTQEALADALGVTSQAVSRWESNGSYPDMELMPSIANFFGISLDELFGLSSDREKRIDEIIAKADSFGYLSRGDDEWVDECLSGLRCGLIEFPQNERLLIKLADALCEAGWRRHHEWLYYDDEGFIQHNYDVHRKNEYWAESVKLCESLVGSASDHTIVTKAISILVLLYRNFGENDKAIAYAERMPALRHCRELELASAADGKLEAEYIGSALLEMASQFATQLVYGLITDKNNFKSDLPIAKLKGAIAIFDLVCEDGNYGSYNGILIELYLYLSRVQWERGYHDDAFASLDCALERARSLEALCDGAEHRYTAALVRFVKTKAMPHSDIAKNLPSDWPMWCNPDYSQVEKEIKSDPRWTKWLEKTQQ